MYVYTRSKSESSTARPHAMPSFSADMIVKIKRVSKKTSYCHLSGVENFTTPLLKLSLLSSM